LPQLHGARRAKGLLEATEHRPQSISSIISREIVRLHARLYGRGPTKAKTYVHAEYVLCALEDIFTPSESTLIEADKEGLVRETRTAFQDATRDEFVAVVERATGRPVRAFHSQIDPMSNTATEVFLLAAETRDEPVPPDREAD
jgi:uncharacterized protein YbcI